MKLKLSLFVIPFLIFGLFLSISNFASAEDVNEIFVVLHEGLLEMEKNGMKLRIDNIKEDKSLENLADHGTTSLIATDKSNRNEKERQRVLLKAAQSGFEYVDSDLSSPKLQSFVNQVKSLGGKCVVSFHDYYKTPSALELNRILEREEG